jgi:RNA polymerase sigma factor (sigma-70 family)
MKSNVTEAPVLAKFDEYLTDFQVDLKKIIGKHRHPNHYWTSDELLSEVNLQLFNKKEDIINCEGQIFNRVSFGKVAYAYARNLIVWTHCRDKKSAYRRRIVDGVHYTEEGEKTTFDLACELEGSEEEGFEAFDAGAKSKYVVKLLREYAHILTERELEILRLMTKEMNQEEMGAQLGITHQAISIAQINITAKIKNYLDFDYKEDDSACKVTKGFEAIESFFKVERE